MGKIECIFWILRNFILYIYIVSLPPCMFFSLCRFPSVSLSLYLFISLSLCLSVSLFAFCISVCTSISYLSLYLFVSLSLCLSVCFMSVFLYLSLLFVFHKTCTSLASTIQFVISKIETWRTYRDDRVVRFVRVHGEMMMAWYYETITVLFTTKLQWEPYMQGVINHYKMAHWQSNTT